MPPSPRVDELLHSKHRIDQDLLASLDADDIASAVSSALDANDPDRVRALEIVARSDPASAVTAAGQLLLQAGDTAQLAAALGSLVPAGAAATPLATTSAAAPDTNLALAAWMTLQRTAGASDLPALQTLAQQATGAVAELASFTVSVIAYRAGVPGFELPVPDPSTLLTMSPGVETVSVGIALASEPDFALLGQLSSAELYALSLTQRATTAIDCVDAHMLLALDDTIFGSLPDGLLQKPALAGLLALLDPFGASYSVLNLVLTWPDGAGAVNILCAQPTGVPVYFGSATTAAGQAQVDIKSVARPGAVPVDLAIGLQPGVLEITRALSAAEVAETAPKLAPDVDTDE